VPQPSPPQPPPLVRLRPSHYRGPARHCCSSSHISLPPSAVNAPSPLLALPSSLPPPSLLTIPTSGGASGEVRGGPGKQSADCHHRDRVNRGEEKMGRRQRGRTEERLSSASSGYGYKRRTGRERTCVVQ
jgi:hypothetical protein